MLIVQLVQVLFLKEYVVIVFSFPSPEQFGIQGPDSYLYTSRSGCLEVDGIDDNHDFKETLVGL
jgi:hypothetical protein